MEEKPIVPSPEPPAGATPEPKPDKSPHFVLEVQSARHTLVISKQEDEHG